MEQKYYEKNELKSGNVFQIIKCLKCTIVLNKEANERCN